MHARWAMLGAFGAILPEALSAFGGDNIPGAVWWQVRARNGRCRAAPARAAPRCASQPRRGAWAGVVVLRRAAARL